VCLFRDGSLFHRRRFREDWCIGGRVLFFLQTESLELFLRSPEEDFDSCSKGFIGFAVFTRDRIMFADWA